MYSRTARRAEKSSAARTPVAYPISTFRFRGKKARKEVESIKKGESFRVIVEIQSAMNLRDADEGMFGGNSDPYVLFQLHDSSKKVGGKEGPVKFKAKTPVVDGQNPKWYYKFTCHCSQKDDMHFNVYDKDMAFVATIA